jgi:hypothetical protein
VALARIANRGLSCQIVRRTPGQSTLPIAKWLPKQLPHLVVDDAGIDAYVAPDPIESIDRAASGLIALGADAEVVEPS